MSALVIILIILLGLFLFILEFFVFPGITFAGIGGFIFTAGGIFSAYQGYGTMYGNITLISTVAVFTGLLIIMFRSKALNRLALDTELEGQVETVNQTTIHEGDEAVSVTRLNPTGNVRVNNEIVEGKCPGQFIDENTKLTIKKVYKTHVIVKPIN